MAPPASWSAPRGARSDDIQRGRRDWKYSADTAAMGANRLERYAVLCGHSLGRAHSRAGDPIAASAYLGKSANFDRAVATYAQAYAGQVQSDYAAFMEAIQDGRVPVTRLA